MKRGVHGNVVLSGNGLCMGLFVCLAVQGAPGCGFRSLCENWHKEGEGTYCGEGYLRMGATTTTRDIYGRPYDATNGCA